MVLQILSRFLTEDIFKEKNKIDKIYLEHG